MVDWETGKPNARYWVLKLLRDNFGPRDRLVEGESANAYVHVMGVLTPNGKRRVLLINKRNRQIELSIPGAANGQEEFVDVTTGFQPPRSASLNSDKITLAGFAVAAVTLTIRTLSNSVSPWGGAVCVRTTTGSDFCRMPGTR
jgi:hypothetical protein